MATIPRPTGSAPRDPTRALATVGAVIAALYFGSEIFVPIALAILLSFVLAPGVRVLRKAHLGRVLPVGLMTALAFLIIFGLSGLMGAQLRNLAIGLPQYQATMTAKIQAIRGLMSGGALKRVGDLFSTLSQDITKPPVATQVQTATPGTTVAPQPLPVIIRQPNPTPIETLSQILRPLLHPLATGGIVAVFVVFILLQREDLRNRLIRILGAGDIHRSTTAIDDAARRLSRYLLAQLAVNTVSGLLVTLALWIIGVPSPVLWGILFGCLRFVPYVGPPLGASLPILLAAAVSPGWSAALWTATVFILIELVVGQVIEPFLYGHNTGLSPVAVVVAATFWTALWGPIGLLLSTPMTACLVVLGRHVEQLSFLDLLLGDRPALTPPEAFYQRLLADDPVDAADQAREALRQTGLTDYYDSVVLPGLLLAQEDADQGRLDGDRQQRLAQATAEVIEDLADAEAAGPEAAHPHALIERVTRGAPEDESEAAPAEAAPPARPAPPWHAPDTVLCLGARGPLDDAAAMLLTQLLQKHGFGARYASFETMLKANIDKADIAPSKLIVLSCLHGSTPAYLRFLMRRLRRKAPRARIFVGTWWRGAEGREPAPDEGLGDGYAATLAEALALCIGHASAETEPEDPGRKSSSRPTPSDGEPRPVQVSVSKSNAGSA